MRVMRLAQMKFKNRKVQSGDMRTPVTFYQYVNEGPYPDDFEEKTLYQCFSHTYAPSMKDQEVLGVYEASLGLTIVIRDPWQDYTPKTNHIVRVEDFRLEQQTFNVYEVRLDAPETGFITIVLGDKK